MLKRSMRVLAISLLLALPGLLAQQPLTSLPYTPSLDLHAMDRSAQPCENFYQYACGTWIKDNPIPPDQPRWDVYSKLTYENQLFFGAYSDRLERPGPSVRPISKRSATFSTPVWMNPRWRRPAPLPSMRRCIRLPR